MFDSVEAKGRLMILTLKFLCLKLKFSELVFVLSDFPEIKDRNFCSLSIQNKAKKETYKNLYISRLSHRFVDFVFAPIPCENALLAVIWHKFISNFLTL